MAKQKLYEVFREWFLPSLTLKYRCWPLAIGLVYIAGLKYFGVLTHDDMVFGLLPLLDFYNRKTRAFLNYFWPFILTGVIYNSMKFYYWPGIAGHIHVAEPYLLDKRLFGISLGGKIVTPNEFFQIYHNSFLDFACGFAYLTFVSEYLLTAFYLFFSGNFQLLKIFGGCFLIVNCLGFATYFIYPAAPPWYVTQYGFGPALMHVQPNAAAAHRFDLLLGTHFFDEIYGRGIDVYGSYPSLHVTYPFLVSFVAFQFKKLRVPAVGFYLLMCLSAVYLQHHYIVDIILGTLYAGTVLAVFCAVIPLSRPGTTTETIPQSFPQSTPV